VTGVYAAAADGAEARRGPPTPPSAEGRFGCWSVEAAGKVGKVLCRGITAASGGTRLAGDVNDVVTASVALLLNDTLPYEPASICPVLGALSAFTSIMQDNCLINKLA